MQTEAKKGSEKMNIAILGYGVVGSGVAKVLKENSKTIAEKTGHEFKLVHILDIRDFPLSEYRSIITKNFEDIANAAYFLGSDMSKNITGAEIVVDGGMSCQLYPQILNELKKGLIEND